MSWYTSQRRQRRTMLPQAAPYRRQKRCKLFGMQSVSGSRRVIADYDPKVDLAPWHNDRPFVLGLYDRRIRKCWGCHSTFAADDERFVVRHQELREFWKKGVGRTMVQYELHQPTSFLLLPSQSCSLAITSTQTYCRRRSRNSRQCSSTFGGWFRPIACVLIHIRQQLCDILVKLFCELE